MLEELRSHVTESPGGLYVKVGGRADIAKAFAVLDLVFYDHVRVAGPGSGFDRREYDGFLSQSGGVSLIAVFFCHFIG